MEGSIRFSLFGNYEKYSTNNAEKYVELINFWAKKGYKPNTTNELQLLPTGQVRVITMPIFVNDNGITIEIMSNRINFHKKLDTCKSIIELKNAFNSDVLGDMIDFISEVDAEGNRVALNCEIIESIDKHDISGEQISNYFTENTNIESSYSNASVKTVENEMTNVIIIKNINYQNKIQKINYDINSLAQNQNIRFKKSNVENMYVAYVDIATEIEKGMI